MNRICILAALFISSSLVVACGGNSPESPPTVTPVLATATFAPPAEAPTAVILPTLAPATVSASPTPAATQTRPAGGTISFGSALQKAESATIYRVEMQIVLQGNFMSGPGVTPTPGSADKPLTLMALKGDVNGKDSRFDLQGLFTDMLGLPEGKPLQVLTSGNKSYVHGPVQMLGATDDKWYELPAQEASAAQPPLTPSAFLSSLTDSGLSPAQVKKISAENFDNLSCDVYQSDQAAAATMLKNVSGPTGSGAPFDTADSADFRFWVCADGLMHQVRLLVQGHDSAQPNQKGSFLMLMHIYDVNGNIQIQAPPNAAPLTPPAFINYPSPTP